MAAADGTRALRFTRWGLAEDPVGLQVITPAGKLRDVVRAYRCELRSVTMLEVRSFNREVTEHVAAGSVRVLDRTWEGK